MKQSNQIIVIKIGSSTLVDSKYRLRQKWLQALAEDISALKGKGYKIVLVSSGAVAIGRKKITEHLHKLTLEQKQAAAAIGQPILINKYSSLLSKFGLNVAQILLTISEVKNRRFYLNAKNTIETLLENDVVPIINENDSVATEELRVGDNDRLSAMVAQMVGADKLIIFSDVAGLYSDDPTKNKDAKFIEVVEEIDNSISDKAKGVRSNTGSGGMATKVDAAKIATENGCETIITSGEETNILTKLLCGEAKNTVFKAKNNPQNARNNWILNNLDIKGKVTIDSGAEKALKNGKSLLPVGVSQIQGNFERGDVVSIISEKNVEIARGISAYNSVDAGMIIGKKSCETEDILGYSGRENLIHADNLTFI